MIFILIITIQTWCSISNVLISVSSLHRLLSPSCRSNNACKNIRWNTAKSFNEDSRFVFFVWECVCQNAGMFFVIFYFGIYENTCDIGNFEFTHFPSQLQNVNPTANLMKIKHSFSLNPTFFFVFWTLQISTYKAKATKIDICTFHISLSSNWCNLVKEKNIHIFPSPSRLIDGGDGKKTFRDGSWLCLSDSEIWWK